jgi:hypothetical protein
VGKKHSNLSQYKWKEDLLILKDICFECGSIDDMHYHHVVPESRGGVKTIPLCAMCHGKVHNVGFSNLSELIKTGLIKAKESGIRLGNPNGLGGYQKMGVQKIKELAETNEANLKAIGVICKAKEQNLTLQQIADKLNSLQYTTRRGKQFTPTQVSRLYERYLKNK